METNREAIRNAYIDVYKMRLWNEARIRQLRTFNSKLEELGFKYVNDLKLKKNKTKDYNGS